MFKSLWKIDDTHCYFSKPKETEGLTCRVKRKRCFLCPYRCPEIDDLKPRDYIGLAHTRISNRMFLWFSIFALIISIFALVLRTSSGGALDDSDLSVRTWKKDPRDKAHNYVEIIVVDFGHHMTCPH